MRPLRIWAAAGLAVLAACSDSAGPAEETFENIAGTYGGEMVAVSQGIALQADFSITVNQTRGSLTGSYSLAGTLTNGIDVVAIQGSGSLSGTIGTGQNPSVNVITMSGPPCNRSSPFSGTYDSANRRINLLGAVSIVDQNCNVVLTYQMNFLLTR